MNDGYRRQLGLEWKAKRSFRSDRGGSFRMTHRPPHKFHVGKWSAVGSRIEIPLDAFTR